MSKHLLFKSKIGWPRPERAELIGKHAVAVTGYGLSAKRATHANCYLNSQQIERLYCHDDQVGPFARMVIQDSGHLATSWSRGGDDNPKVEFVPEQLLIPLYHKVRLPFAGVIKYVFGFNEFLNILRKNGLAIPDSIDWDVILTSVNDYKSEALNKPGNFPKRRDTLEASMPRFFWRARAVEADNELFDLLFDATDIEFGNSCFRVVEYDERIGNVLRLLDQYPEARTLFERDVWRRPAGAFLRDTLPG